jgi:glutathione synthase/RimK-type ligase-like ATP-grasp enzyme
VKLAFIVDPLEGLKAYKDSSVAMMRCAAKRGHEIWTIQRECADLARRARRRTRAAHRSRRR